MKLYHFSNNKFDTIKIDYFGYNSYTKNDAQYLIKRFFCYDTLQAKEYTLKNCDYRYTIEIDDNNIYNLDNDNLKLKEIFNFDIDLILDYISKNYIACCYTTSFLCYCIFQNIKPVKTEKRLYNEYKKIS